MHKVAILNHLDNPARMIVWTMDELLVFCGILILGLSQFDMEVSLLLSILLYQVYKRVIKLSFRNINAKVLYYWYMPYMGFCYKYCLPSDKRKILG